MGQNSYELGPRSRLAFNIEIGGPGGGAEATHLHNGGSPSKNLAQFFSQNIVPLPHLLLRPGIEGVWFVCFVVALGSRQLTSSPFRYDRARMP